jgi:hypothetical protein
MSDSVSKLRKLIHTVCSVGILLAGGAVAADPLDLSNPTPRWVEVRFEVSPEDAPGRLDEVWSPVRRAYLAPDPAQQTVQIRIPAGEVEAQLLSTGTEPVFGTFSDFLWTLDAESGHVLEAGLSGRVRQTLGLGIFRASGEVEIRVEMTTRRAAGFRPPHRILGQQTHPFCVVSEGGNGCTLVEPIRFDPKRGYVNAVGSLRAITPVATVRTFSPLGEVLFSEFAPNPTDSVASGRSSHDAVCSGPTRGSCRPDLRGESS